VVEAGSGESDYFARQARKLNSKYKSELCFLNTLEESACMRSLMSSKINAMRIQFFINIVLISLPMKIYVKEPGGRS